MKRKVIVLLAVAFATTFVVAILLRTKHQTPLEIARLSESLVISKVHAYYRNPSEPNLVAVKDAVANHRDVLERTDLSREAREVMEVNLHEQISIVRSVARNYDLKL